MRDGSPANGAVRVLVLVLTMFVSSDDLFERVLMSRSSRTMNRRQ